MVVPLAHRLLPLQAVRAAGEGNRVCQHPVRRHPAAARPPGGRRGGRVQRAAQGFLPTRRGTSFQQSERKIGSGVFRPSGDHRRQARHLRDRGCAGPWEQVVRAAGEGDRVCQHPVRRHPAAVRPAGGRRGGRVQRAAQGFLPTRRGTSFQQSERKIGSGVFRPSGDHRRQARHLRDRGCAGPWEQVVRAGDHSPARCGRKPLWLHR